MNCVSAISHFSSMISAVGLYYWGCPIAVACCINWCCLLLEDYCLLISQRPWKLSTVSKMIGGNMQFFFSGNRAYCSVRRFEFIKISQLYIHALACWEIWKTALAFSALYPPDGTKISASANCSMSLKKKLNYRKFVPPQERKIFSQSGMCQS